MFRNRTEAGQLLATRLLKFKSDKGVVMAVPRGGIPVAYPVAMALQFPLEIILTKKIGHPANREYAIGAASLKDYFITHHENISEKYIHAEVESIRAYLRKLYFRFMGHRLPANPEGKTVIVIDDGVATGNTLLATVRLLRKSHPEKIIVAVPVAPAHAVRRLAAEADEVIALLTPGEFHGVGAFYEDFTQVSDDGVLALLDKFRDLRKAG